MGIIMLASQPCDVQNIVLQGSSAVEHQLPPVLGCELRHFRE